MLVVVTGDGFATLPGAVFRLIVLLARNATIEVAAKTRRSLNFNNLNKTPIVTSGFSFFPRQTYLRPPRLSPKAGLIRV